MKRLLKIILPMIGKLGLVRYIGLGILSGLCGFMFITFLTKVVGLIIAGKYTVISKEYVLIFILIILSYIWTRKTLSLSIIGLSQKLLWNLRKQVLSSVLNANYIQLSGRKTQVRSTIFGDVYTLIDASMNIISFCTSLTLAFASLVYLSTISWLLFLITLGIATIGAVVYHVSSAKNRAGFEPHRKL